MTVSPSAVLGLLQLVCGSVLRHAISAVAIRCVPVKLVVFQNERGWRETTPKEMDRSMWNPPFGQSGLCGLEHGLARSRRV